MNLFGEVKAEHHALERMIERLGLAARIDGIGAWGRIWAVLALLLPVLENHEELETFLIEKESYLKEPGAAAILDEIEEQHLHLKKLMEQIRSLPIQPAQGPLSRLRRWSEELAALLRLHFKTEEDRLWPHYIRTMSRSLGRSMGRLMENNALGAKKILKKTWGRNSF